MADVCVITAICEADAIRWGDQYLREMERLDVPFAIHLDKCTEETRQRFISHPNCIGHTANCDPAVIFNETHKQGVLDIAAGSGATYSLSCDSDDTFEPEAPAKLRAMPTDIKLGLMRYWHVWGDWSTLRVDGPFNGAKRERIYNLKYCNWHFRVPIVNGAYASVDIPRDEWIDIGIACFHWGFIGIESCQEHRDRWNKIYGAANGGTNPYGAWEWACDLSHLATKPNPYAMQPGG